MKMHVVRHAFFVVKSFTCAIILFREKREKREEEE